MKIFLIAVIFFLSCCNVNTPTSTIQTTLTPVVINTSTPSEASEIFGIGSTMTSPKDGMTLVYVPAGEFKMGSDSADQRPVHTVYLDAYWIDQFEVTNAMYSICIQDSDCNEPSDITYYSDSSYANHPVVYIDWDDARNYCSWAGRKLPTEAEWEKAASWDEVNQIKNAYPWGNNIDCSFANYNDGGNYCVGTTTAVGSYPNGASPYGALDMAGNVWEWVADWYDMYPGGDPMASTNFGQTYRVQKGGSWFSNDVFAHSAFRGGFFPSFTDHYLGFRCAISASE